MPGRLSASVLALGLLATASVKADLLTIANTTGGGVRIGATTFDFFNPVGGGLGDFATGGNTIITYSGGVLTPATNPYGRILDFGTSSSLPLMNFMQFYTGVGLPSPPGSGTPQTFPAFDLVGLIPGGSVQGALNDCAGVTATGVSCSPGILPPLVLTNRGAYTDVSFGVSLLLRDAVKTSAWSGGFTGQVVGLTPSAIQTLLAGGGTISTTYSATLAPGAGDVIPEPATLLLSGAGVLLVFLARRHSGSRAS